MSLQELTELFKALSDITRLKILKLLEKGELCVCDIIAALDVVQPKVSFHLKVLKSAGLIKDKKIGRWTHYSINETDIFKRFILLSVIEKIDDSEVQGCRDRLSEFLKNKPKILSKSYCQCGGK